MIAPSKSSIFHPVITTQPVPLVQSLQEMTSKRKASITTFKIPNDNFQTYLDSRFTNLIEQQFKIVFSMFVAYGEVTRSV
jgi:hypothetical protein